MRAPGRHFGEADALSLQHGLLPGERLPAQHRHVDVGRRELDGVAHPAGRLGGDQRGARAAERLVDRLAGAAVVLDRPAHALDRLLRAVHRLGVLRPAGDLPQGGLLAVAGPVALAAHGIPAGFVLPVVVTPPEHQPVLGPDDLRPDLEARRDQALGHRRGVQGAVPHVCDVAGEQRPGLAPVRPVVVRHLAHALRVAQPRPVAPGRVVFHAVGWVGHHQVRAHAVQRALDRRCVGAVAADQPVAAQQPDVARAA